MKVIDDMVKYLSKEKALPVEVLEALFDQGLILDRRPLRRMLVSLIEEAARDGRLETGSIATFCIKYSLEAYLYTYCHETKASLDYANEHDPECVPWIEKQLMKALRCDPLYTQFCVQRREWACRVSPKVGRENDYVARYWVTIGEGQEDEGAVELVRYHDELITGRSTE